ncbi:hypothetical protein TNIN_323641 [Trichonephila inaurata madagascariensis]|uniref:Uncharacterized protein n=1 Tax=Trichonephila inaurata madagascariensis TaxID=2747483 RepID=A0A8X6MKE2_9ARAC|nr:hypothetical protein TNIN_323641 [Trichonephila inaurata madagascariensis]
MGQGHASWLRGAQQRPLRAGSSHEETVSAEEPHTRRDAGSGGSHGGGQGRIRPQGQKQHGESVTSGPRKRPLPQSLHVEDEAQQLRGGGGGGLRLGRHRQQLHDPGRGGGRQRDRDFHGRMEERQEVWIRDRRALRRHQVRRGVV